MQVPLPEPTVLDRVVGWVSPSAGLRRLRARAGLLLLQGSGGGGYEAGRSDSTAMKRYRTRTGSAITDIHPDIQTIRDRSRDQARNNPLAGGAISTVVTSAVGTGLDAQPNIDRDVLGLSEEEADAWEAQAERIWRLWADSTECDIEGELNFGQLQALVLRSVLESGDVLRLRRFLWDDSVGAPGRGGLFGTKVQLIEADRISNPDWQYDTTQVAGGVEVDGDGRPVAYWVRTRHPGENLYFRSADRWMRVPVRSPETGQRRAALLFDKRRIGQRRGVPYLAPVIKALLQLDRYTEAELMAAVVSAMFTVFVTTETPETHPLQSAIGGDAEALANEETADAGEINLGNGTIVDLAPGEKVDIANPGRPNDVFDPFVMSILRQVGVALELPFEVLVKHFQSSYSASRGALLEAWKFFKVRRKWTVDALCQPCYEDVIGEAVARGMLDAPGFFDDPVVRRAWLGVQWTGDAMPQIDPLKEVNASEKRVAMGVSTIDREARELNGSNFLENHRQRRKEARMRRDDGLESGSGPALALVEDEGPDDVDMEDDAEDRLLIGAGS